MSGEDMNAIRERDQKVRVMTVMRPWSSSWTARRDPMLDVEALKCQWSTRGSSHQVLDAPDCLDLRSVLGRRLNETAATRDVRPVRKWVGAGVIAGVGRADIGVGTSIGKKTKYL